MTINAFEPPYAIFLGDEADPGFAKTGYGLVEWRNELCVGQIRFPGSPIDLGLPELSLADLKGKANALIIGVAARGGDISPDWLDALKEVARAGIDIVAGTHVSVNAYVTNVGNSSAYQTVFAQAPTFAFGVPLRPRTIGGNVRVDF